MTTAAVELSPESPHVLEEGAYLEILKIMKIIGRTKNLIIMKFKTLKYKKVT